jgi:hypothetical protein
MKCNDFDSHIDEMLSGILHPDANQHAAQCERCSSHLSARAGLQSSLRKLASAAPAAPSRATDRAVMESYRRLQQRRAAWNSEPVSDAASPRLLTVPRRSPVPEWAAPRSWASRALVSRTWLSGAAAAALVFAVFGSAVHLWTGVGTVSAPTVSAPSAVAPVVATAPSASQPVASVTASRHSAAVRSSDSRTLATNSARALQPRTQSQFVAPQLQEASTAVRSEQTDAPVLAAKATSPRPPVVYAGGQNYDSGPVTQTNASVMRLASSGTSGNMAQSASSTWPGYSNLMYCDPVVCSGPMQVVHIKVPVGQVKPNLGQTTGNAFVNAEVVIGPDGVARAIRVAN